MDELETKNHHVMVKNRESLEITGIKKIESLNSDEFILESILGYMTIQGENLEMVNLNTNTGELSILGSVTTIFYHEKIKSIEKKESFLKKILK